MEFDKFFTIFDLNNFISSGRLNNIPVDVIKDIINSFDEIILSPNSTSIYNKIKGYGFTIDGTIRLSDHWNWKYKDVFKYGSEIHSKTNIDITQDQWAMGKYDKTTDTYIILKLYDKNRLVKNEKKSVLRYLTAKLKPVIDRRKLVQDLMRDMRITIHGESVSGNVISIKKDATMVIRTPDGEIINKPFLHDRMVIKLDNEVFDITAEEMYIHYLRTWRSGKLKKVVS